MGVNVNIIERDFIFGLTAFTGAVERYGRVNAVGAPKKRGDDPIYLVVVGETEGMKMTLRYPTFSSRKVER